MLMGVLTHLGGTYGLTLKTTYWHIIENNWLAVMSYCRHYDWNIWKRFAHDRTSKCSSICASTVTTFSQEVLSMLFKPVFWHMTVCMTMWKTECMIGWMLNIQK